ncbi:MAG: polyprenyl synthetase family protein [Bifidobacteriaceae bacterium]|nr:polyprenyl synthetase family protein [Bifidobacteriaceae bacterium]
MITDGPAQAFVDATERVLEERLALVARDLSPRGFTAMIGVEGLKHTHEGGSRPVTRLMWTAYVAHGGASSPMALDEHSVKLIAASQEMFVDAVLIHDDLAARADIRRGHPSLHRYFQDLHDASGWTGDSGRLGAALAQIVGDALLVVSGDVFAEAVRGVPDEQAARLSAMRQSAQLERVLGQAMDAIYPCLPGAEEPEEVIQQAVAAMLVKTSRYLGALPLALGAACAGASDEECAVMEAAGVPLGSAYQLRDDIRGALASSEETGKPTGQDLIDGKRTVLAGFTMRLLEPAKRRLFVNALLRGATPPVEARVDHLQKVIRRSGALQAVEEIVAERRHAAVEYLKRSTISPAARASLVEAFDWLLTAARM